MIVHLKRPEKFWFVCGICWIAYVCAYFGRVNLSITLPYLQDIYGYSKTVLGSLASGFFISYAAGQLINGILGDRFNPRYFVFFGLCAAGISNILFGCFRGFIPLFIFWTCNGYFQSMLWGPMVRTSTESTPPVHLHKAALILSSSTIIGYLLSYTLIGKITVIFGWKMAFYIPGIILIAVAVLWLWLLPLCFQSPAARPAEKEKTGSAIEKKRKGGSPLYFLVSTKLWIVTLICVFQGSIKEGLTLWSPTFFAESQSLPLDQVLYIMTLVPFMNLLAILFCGVVNRLFGHREKFTIAFFLVFASVFAVMLHFAAASSFIIMSLAFCGLFASIFAVNNMLTAFIPLHFRNAGRVSTAAGLLDCAVYIGAALSGPFAGLLIDRLGWAGITGGWIASAVLALLMAFLSRDYKETPP